MSGYKKLNIVIAEDDLDDAMIIENSFINNAHFESVKLVGNGQQLIEYLRANPQPDVILTDINMPIMDGIEALEVIRNSSDFNKIPCFVYSTSINPNYETRSKSLGVKGYLVKPNTIEGFDDIPVEILRLLEKEN
ncbi:MAG: response regulator [Bacteroidota bacterium]